VADTAELPGPDLIHGDPLTRHFHREDLRMANKTPEPDAVEPVREHRARKLLHLLSREKNVAREREGHRQTAAAEDQGYRDQR
jgi:hypothetical protein